MIAEMAKDKAGAEKRCEEAYEKARQLQSKLNDVITFVDPKEQLEHLPEEGKMRGVPIARHSGLFVLIGDEIGAGSLTAHVEGGGILMVIGLENEFVHGGIFLSEK